MNLFRVPGRHNLDVSSDSPLVKGYPFNQSRSLDASSLLIKSNAGYVGNPPYLLGSPLYPTPLDDLRVSHICSSPEIGEPGRRISCTTPKSNFKTSFSRTPKSREDVIEANGSPSFTRRLCFDSRVIPLTQEKHSRMVNVGTFPMKLDLVQQNLTSNIDPSYILNPNKAVLTVDATGKILTANDMTTLLLGEDLLRDQTSIFDHFSNPKDIEMVRETLNHGGRRNKFNEDTRVDMKPEVAAEEDMIEPEGLVVFSGIVVSLVTDEMEEKLVSLWMKALPVEEDEEPRWISVLEPITTIVSKIKVNESGEFVKTDKNFSLIFDSEPSSIDSIFQYISSVKLPENDQEEGGIEQSCTGQTRDLNVFPLTVSVSMATNKDEMACPMYNIKIKMFCNISGLVVVDKNGIVLQCNHNFTRLLLGYGSKDLVGKNITQILPDFDISSRNNHQRNKFFDSETTNNRDEASNGLNCAYEQTYIDHSSKENQESKMENELVYDNSSVCKSKESGGLSQDFSLESPNNAFIISDSQFTLNSLNATQKSSLANPSFNQAASKSGSELPGSFVGSPSRNEDVMRDITNSINVLSVGEYPDQSRFPLNASLLTSTPAVHKFHDSVHVHEGSYFTEAKHKDGTSISVMYQIRRLALDGKDLYCVWIIWEPSDSSHCDSKLHPYSHSSGTQSIKSKLFNNSKTCSDSKDIGFIFSPLKIDNTSSCALASADNQSSISPYIDSDEDDSDDDSSLSLTKTDGSSSNEYSLDQSHEEEVKRRSLSENEVANRKKQIISKLSSSKIEEPEWILASGKYNENYTILKQIGKGAFGYVKSSYRNKDGLIVISKFIKKAQVYKDSWTEYPDTGKKVCMEVYLLLKLDHPNIVKALDAYENEKYFQLVMEKFGSGMDLFEFIERNPALDEPLTSYIFRQVVSPLLYLRSMNVIHRDIKDENIIINEKFHIRLIDFGSATYLEPDKKFAQFAGTIEYCSPEVLKGNKYSGPELEIWSLGVTLYTLIFGENPFNTVDQVLLQPLVIPITYSENLSILLKGMLDKDPNERMDLEQVSDHCWTNQDVDIETYNFQTIVQCSNEELSPARYVNDFGLSEESFSTTSSSFVYEDKMSSGAFVDRSVDRSFKSIGSSVSQCEADLSCDVTEGDSFGIKDESDSCSRTSTSRSSVTIDSSVFHISSLNETGKKSSSSSNTDSADLSVNDVEALHSRSLSDSKEPDEPFCLRRDSGSSDSLTSFSSTSSNVSGISSSGSSSNNGSSDSSSDSSNSSLGSQEIISIESSSDEHTLAHTFTNVMAFEQLSDQN